MALEDDGAPMVLRCLSSRVDGGNAARAFAYASSYGDAAMRDTWREKTSARLPGVSPGKISRPVVTNALTHGLSLCGYLFMDPGDTLVVPDCFWGNYRLIFSVTYGVQIDTFSTFKDGAFNLEAFEHRVRAGGEDTLRLLLNFPNNPSGYTPTVEEFSKMAAILKDAAEAGKKICVICDDAYFGLVYEEGILRDSPFAVLCGLHPNLLAVKVDGATKEDYVWGFRTGFVTFGTAGGEARLYDALESKAGGAVRGTISNASNLSQHLLKAAYADPAYEEEKQEKYRTLHARYRKVREILDTHPEYDEFFSPLPFNSGYFMCLRLKNLEAETVRKILLEKHSIGVIAIGKMLRLAYSATPLSRLERLFGGIVEACREASGGSSEKA
jgi:aspartate/methionine/tyrosine aminotransferase